MGLKKRIKTYCKKLIFQIFKELYVFPTFLNPLWGGGKFLKKRKELKGKLKERYWNVIKLTKHKKHNRKRSKLSHKRSILKKLN